MKTISEKKLLIINIIFIGLEIGILLLTLLRILAFDDGLERRINITMLITVILIQVLFLDLIRKSVGKDNRIRLYFGQMILLVCIAVWLALSVDIY